MMPDERTRRLQRVRELYTEEGLLLSVALDLKMPLEEIGEPLAEGLLRVRAVIDEALEVLPRRD